jgi:hypothetical protein
VLKVAEDSNYLFFYVSEAMAYPVPKRAFSTSDFEQFRAHLRAWLGERAEL